LTDDSAKGIVVRNVTSEDEEKMVAYFESLGQASRDFFHPHPFDRENARRVCGSTDRQTFCVVAEHEDRIIGYAWFGMSEKSPYPMLGIGISDNAQGKGLGRILMDTLIEEARRRNHAGLRLTVYPNNDRAVRLYTNCGFKIVGEKGQEHVMDLVF